MNHLEFSYRLSELVLQLGIIIIAARLAGMLFKRLNLPSVLGELLAGMMIGPYALGGISFHIGNTCFTLFQINEATNMPVTWPILLTLASLGAIVLLFRTGLETDFRMFTLHSKSGIAIGFSGVIVSFLLGNFLCIKMLSANFLDIRCLILGILCTATSVGFTAKILSRKHCLDTPEGNTILGAALMDDALGLIGFAIIVCLYGNTNISNSMTSETGKAILQAAIALLVFGALLFWFPRHNNTRKSSNLPTSTCFICFFAGCLLLSAICAHLNMPFIIGAYISGLILARTNVAMELQERLRNTHRLLVPLFFAVIGMLVNFRIFASSDTIIFGLLLTAAAIIAKVIGCMLPALFMNFNSLGALRIGIGMVPRGGVSLIIAGYSALIVLGTRTTPILHQTTLGAVIIMILLTSVIANPLLTIIFDNKKKGVKQEKLHRGMRTLNFPIPATPLRELLVKRITQYFCQEGFSCTYLSHDNGIIYFKNNETTFLLSSTSGAISFECALNEAPLIRSIMNETSADFRQTMEDISKVTEFSSEPTPDAKSLVNADIPFDDKNSESDLSLIIPEDCVITDMKAETFEDAMVQIVRSIADKGYVSSFDDCLADLQEREKLISTMLPGGIALPHAKTTSASKMLSVIALCTISKPIATEDIEPFRGKHIIILTVSPKDKRCPYMQYIAHIASVLHKCPDLDAIRNTTSPELLRKHFIN